ncbi:hypothetical protein NX801_00290 [Streptomyces sp. LP05-1]|uniref:Aminoglycoside phosphotransferase domain-containing protein n=1 Tax=Streptomyces pyxinae TaxID=2970734 RepID=A0ABT2CAI9_9ACTN|nr:phosphotransferase [Streptomyces sp. LP05-1]MCS0634127.1 hypothetical protein [Streptomyces sp. LP05-1]
MGTTRSPATGIGIRHYDPTAAPGGFTEAEMRQVLERACAAVGLDSADAQLLRGHTNAVVLLEAEKVVVKIARKGTAVEEVRRTVEFVRWLMDVGFPTVTLHPAEVVAGGHAAILWTYLPQPDHSIEAAQLAKPLFGLHNLPTPPAPPPGHDNFAAIRRSLQEITCLPSEDLRFLQRHAERLSSDLETVRFALPGGVIQGDPQRRWCSPCG